MTNARYGKKSKGEALTRIEQKKRDKIKELTLYSSLRLSKPIHEVVMAITVSS